MSIFNKYEWQNRVSEYPSRRKLTAVEGMQDVYDVTREEGIISQQGSAFSQENMNNLENRIFNAFNSTESRTNSALVGTVLYSSGGDNGSIYIDQGKGNYTDYDYLEILYKENIGSCYHCLKAFPKFQNKWKLSDIRHHYDSGSNLMVINCKSIIINDTVITTGNWCRFDIISGQYPVIHNNAGDDDLFILKVIGYKNNI